MNIVRLNILLAPDVARVLVRRCRLKGLSVTEGIRRAIAIIAFVYDEQAKGNRIAMIERGRFGGERVREIKIH